MRPDAIVDYQDTGCAVIRHDARDLPLEDGSVDLIVQPARGLADHRVGRVPEVRTAYVGGSARVAAMNGPTDAELNEEARWLGLRLELLTLRLDRRNGYIAEPDTQIKDMARRRGLRADWIREVIHR